MLIQQQPAYILHTRRYRETSLLLECLTDGYGRVGMVARGVRRARTRLSASVLQPFQLLEMSWSQRGELGTLRSAEPTGRPLLLAGNALLAGLYVNELVVRLSVRQDPHGGLYGVYARTIERLGQDGSLAWTLRCFERDLLQAIGYAVQVESDPGYRKPLQADVDYVYLPEDGPVQATAGAHGLRIRGSDLMALAADRKPDGPAMERLRRLLRGLLLHQLGGVPLRSWQVFGGKGSRN